MCHVRLRKRKFMRIGLFAADLLSNTTTKEVAPSLSSSDGERAGVRGALLLTLCMAIHTSLAASTNDLATALQKGLFEEEANHNFPAAIEAYQGVINRFDEDRKLAATAIFRVGEIYRKQGKTNEANAQYERVVREFPDQSALATLSQSYIAAAAIPSNNATTANANSESAPTSDEAEEVKKIRAMIRDSPDLINAKDGGGNTPLYRAAWSGHLMVAQFLVENRADANAKNNDGNTPLHIASLSGHKALVELLLSHGTSVRVVDSSGNTPLHAAAQMGFRSIVEVFLAHGAEVNAKTKSGSTPLHMAVANGFKSVAELLLTPMDVNAVTDDVRDQQQHVFKGTALHIAASRGDEPLVELLLAHQANPNSTNNAGDTPLHIAAQLGDPKTAELLLANKATVDLINNNGETPLDLSAKLGLTSTTGALLAHGANVNARNPVDRGWKGWTPLLYAVAARQKEAADLLLKNGANPNAKIESANGSWIKGCTPLIMAAWQNEPEIVATLLDSKADPNLKDDARLTPARAGMRASDTSGGKRILSLLLDHGADTDAQDSDGKTLLMLAAERKDKEIVGLLLAHKADVNPKNPAGLTALHFMAFSLQQGSHENVPDIAEALLAAGANVNLQDNQGKTAYHYAAHPFPQPIGFDPVRDKVIKLLQAHGAVENLPRLDAIEVRRSEANFSKVIFTRGTNGWDQFTLFDLIGVQYQLMSSSSGGESRSTHRQSAMYAPDIGLDFPDFAHIRVRHPKPDFKEWDERTIDIDSALTGGDCSADVPLELGDQVEIPEADHVLNGKWEGLSKPILATLKKCLTRHVTVVVKGQSKTYTLALDYTTNDFAGVFESGHSVAVAEVRKFAPVMIMPALAESKLLLASSDLSHIKLIRSDPATGQKRELLVDGGDNKRLPSVWLRDGDVIEVPDKP